MTTNQMYPFPQHIGSTRIIVFVDGENLAIRFGAVLGENKLAPRIEYERDVYVWTEQLNMHHHRSCDVIRRHYYTSVMGDSDKRSALHDRLQSLGIESPHVFVRSKGKGSKRVDISLTTDMLTHAFRDNYDAAVLIAGDEDYVPLVDAVSNLGKNVFLWFIDNGLSQELRRRAHHYFDMTCALTDPHKFGLYLGP